MSEGTLSFGLFLKHNAMAENGWNGLKWAEKRRKKSYLPPSRNSSLNILRLRKNCEENRMILIEIVPVGSSHQGPNGKIKHFVDIACKIAQFHRNF